MPASASFPLVPDLPAGAPEVATAGGAERSYRALRSEEAQGPLRENHPLAPREQLRRRDQEPQQGRGRAGEGHERHARLPRRRAQGARAHVHQLRHPARALLREPRGRREAGGYDSEGVRRLRSLRGAVPCHRDEPGRWQRLGDPRLQLPHGRLADVLARQPHAVRRVR